MSYTGEFSNAGAAATIEYSLLGYDLFSTSPVGDDSQDFLGSYNAFQAGTQIQQLPSFVSSITAPSGVDTISSAGFLYSNIDDPASPGLQVQAGLEGAHAPGPNVSVPLLDINLSPTADAPTNFDIGFMTNVHVGRPDDYPATITVSDGSAAATATTGQDATGGVDVFEFQVNNAKPGDQIVVAASQPIRNYTGGAYNPSVSALLFDPGSAEVTPPPSGGSPPPVNFITPPIIQPPPTIIPPPDSTNTSPAPTVNVGGALTSIDDTGSQFGSGNGGNAVKDNSVGNNAVVSTSNISPAAVPSSVFPLPKKVVSGGSINVGDPFSILLFSGGSQGATKQPTPPFTTSSIITNGSSFWGTPTSSVTKPSSTGTGGGIIGTISNFFGNTAKAIGNFFGSIF